MDKPPIRSQFTCPADYEAAMQKYLASHTLPAIRVPSEPSPGTGATLKVRTPSGKYQSSPPPKE